MYSRRTLSYATLSHIATLPRRQTYLILVNTREKAISEGKLSEVHAAWNSPSYRLISEKYTRDQEPAYPQARTGNISWYVSVMCMYIYMCVRVCECVCVWPCLCGCVDVRACAYPQLRIGKRYWCLSVLCMGIFAYACM